MNRCSMIMLPGYEGRERLYRSARTTVYRGVRSSDGLAVVVKLLETRGATLDDIARRRREYELLRRFSSPGIASALAYERSSEAHGLILHDIGGVSLARLLRDGRLPLDRILHIAIAVANALDTVHAKGIVHRDVHPGNIIVNQATGETILADFDIAALLPAAGAGLPSSDSIEGTFAYMAPEQTGRTALPVDARSDYYALGVTLFEMLCGRKPFQATDAMEYAHQHIARRPPRADEADAGVPARLADMVETLLAKAPRERYQSAAGLKRDLEECARQLRETGRIEAFPLSSHTTSGVFRVPELLYGRDATLQLLGNAFERVSHGGCELALVTGFAGAGKSALLRHAAPLLAGMDGIVGIGVHDREGRYHPYAGLAQALRSVLRRLLGTAERDVAILADELRLALGSNAPVLLSMLPELGLLLGDSRDASEALAENDQRRVTHAVTSFLRVAAAVAPVALCFDEAQWADQGSVDVFEELLLAPSTTGLLLVLAFKEGDVDHAHCLARFIETARRAGVPILDLPLGPLPERALAELVHDTLGDLGDEAAPLLRFLLARSGGSPLHARHLLTALYDSGAIRFDASAARWNCDLARAEAGALPESIGALLSLRLDRLEVRSRELLWWGAMAGSVFDARVLAAALDVSAAEVLRGLQAPIAEDLLLPAGSAEPVVSESGGGSDGDLLSGVYPLRYRFAHARIKAAADAAFPERDRAQAHARLGHAMLAAVRGSLSDERLFELVEQLNAAAAPERASAEATQLAGLNLQAGKRARKAGAYEGARTLFLAGLATLADDRWTTQRNLAFSLLQGQAECEYLLGNFGLAGQLFDELTRRASRDDEYAHIVSTNIALCINVGRYRDAILLAIEGLRRFGIELEADVSDRDAMALLEARRSSFEDLDIASLVDLPEMSDPVMRHAMVLLEHAGAAAYLTQPALYAVFCMELVSISLHAGNTAASSYGYSGLGVLFGAFLGKYQAGYAFGELAVAVARRFGDTAALCRSTMMLGGFINHWSRPAAEALPLLETSHRLGVESGVPVFAGYSLLLDIYLHLFLGRPLGAVAARAEAHAAFLQRMGEERGLLTMRMLVQVCRALQGQTRAPALLDDDEYDQEAAWEQMRAAPTMVPQLVALVNRVRMLCLHQRYEEALHEGDRAAALLPAAAGMIFLAEFHFFDALAAVGHARAGGPEVRGELLSRARGSMATLARWSAECPWNFEDKRALLTAEIADVEDNRHDAGEQYSLAIDAARCSGFVQNEALACECAARFHIARGEREQGRVLMLEAIDAWERWGAVARTRELLRQYPALAPERHTTEASPSPDTTTTTSSVFDAASLVKASQAISSELVLSDLLRTMMRVLIENAGAQRGALALEQNGVWRVAADARVGDDTVAMPADLRLDRSADVPASLVLLTARSREPLSADDPAEHAEYRHDPVIRARRPKSVLCLPLLSGSTLLGVLYLEHLDAAGTFPPARIEPLQVLVRQTAISLQNALLYRRLQDALLVARDAEEARREAEIHRREAEIEQRKNREIQAAFEQLKLTQSQLVYAEKMVSLGELTAGIAHEINNPLNFVRSFAELNIDALLEAHASLAMVEGTPVTADLAATLDGALDNSRRMLDHIERVTSIVRAMQLHARKTGGTRESVSINDVLRDALALALSGTHEAGDSVHVSVSESFDAAMPELLLDEQGMSRVFVNIIQNALYVLRERAGADPSFQPRLAVSTAWEGSATAIRIEDNGGGIPDAMFPKLFQPFTTTKPAGTGTGLGLSMSYEIIVQGHGGTLRAENTPDGAAFIITLPSA